MHRAQGGAAAETRAYAQYKARVSLVRPEALLSARGPRPSPAPQRASANPGCVGVEVCCCENTGAAFARGAVRVGWGAFRVPC